MRSTHRRRVSINHEPRRGVPGLFTLAGKNANRADWRPSLSQTAQNLFCIIVLTIHSMVGTACQATSPEEPSVRTPEFAGQFYPQSGSALNAALSAFASHAVHLHLTSAPAAILVPHAGYVYSGQIASDAYVQANPFSYDLIVVLGTNHRVAGFQGISVDQARTFQTPLGPLASDQAMASALVAPPSSWVYRPALHAKEHSVEVQLPFLRRHFPRTPVLTAVLSTEDEETCTAFARDLDRLTQGKTVLVVASSDLSHYPPMAQAVQTDQKTLEAIASMNPRHFLEVARQQMQAGVKGLDTCACGAGPIMTAMAFAGLRGCKEGAIVSYANSGQSLIGDSTRVVGYGACCFVDETRPHTVRFSPPIPEEPFPPLNKKQQILLLEIARETLNQYLLSETLPLIRPEDSRLWAQQGAFVTLKKGGELRGCIGHMAEDLPLAQCVGRMALQAAFNDHRFPRLSRKEWPDVHLEISVLTPFRKVEGVNAIQLGRDGILLEKGGHSAVFLPQVAQEQGWSLEETLTHLSAKAGLEPNAWRSGTTFFTFQAQVFSEEAH